MLFKLLAVMWILCVVFGENPQNAKQRPVKKQKRIRDYDSFEDRCGNEHVIDDDGYCEECDDYHDDW